MYLCTLKKTFLSCIRGDVIFGFSLVICSSLFNEFVCKLGPRVPKRPNLHMNELNTTFFCSTSPLKASNRLKSLKLA
jgi:hypothetical protein